MVNWISRARAFLLAASTTLALGCAQQAAHEPPPSPMEAPSTTSAGSPPPSPAPGDNEASAASVDRSRAAADSAPVAGQAPAGGVQRVLTPVLVELGPKDARLARAGGSAVALLSADSRDRDRNLALCRALFRSFDEASIGEVRVGERRNEATGEIERLRPLYWLLRDLNAAAGQDACASRLARYDFERAGRIRAKLNLTGRGPYLAVIAADDRRAGVVDLGAAPLAETETLVKFFRDGFSQDADVWSPERNVAERSRGPLEALLGRPAALAELPRLIVVSASQALCPAGDLFDACGGSR